MVKLNIRGSVYIPKPPKPPAKPANPPAPAAAP